MTTPIIAAIAVVMSVCLISLVIISSVSIPSHHTYTTPHVLVISGQYGHITDQQWAAILRWLFLEIEECVNPTQRREQSIPWGRVNRVAVYSNARLQLWYFTKEQMLISLKCRREAQVFMPKSRHGSPKLPLTIRHRQHGPCDTQ